MADRPITTDEEHRSALVEIEALWGAEEGTPEGDRLDALATRVAAFEDQQEAVRRAAARDPDAPDGDDGGAAKRLSACRRFD